MIERIAYKNFIQIPDVGNLFIKQSNVIVYNVWLYSLPLFVSFLFEI